MNAKVKQVKKYKRTPIKKDTIAIYIHETIFPNKVYPKTNTQTVNAINIAGDICVIYEFKYKKEESKNDAEKQEPQNIKNICAIENAKYIHRRWKTCTLKAPKTLLSRFLQAIILLGVEE